MGKDWTGIGQRLDFPTELSPTFHYVILQKISKQLSDCVNYIHAVHFHNFEDSEKSGKYYHMSSFGESKATGFAEGEEAKAFVKYNTRQISRIYPGAARQDSSNLKPFKFWNAGCQIGENLAMENMPIQAPH